MRLKVSRKSNSKSRRTRTNKFVRKNKRVVSYKRRNMKNKRKIGGEGVVKEVLEPKLIESIFLKDLGIGDKKLDVDDLSRLENILKIEINKDNLENKQIKDALEKHIKSVFYNTPPDGEPYNSENTQDFITAKNNLMGRLNKHFSGPEGQASS